jgi:hypothetical protein
VRNTAIAEIAVTIYGKINKTDIIRPILRVTVDVKQQVFQGCLRNVQVLHSPIMTEPSWTDAVAVLDSTAIYFILIPVITLIVLPTVNKDIYLRVFARE